MCIFGPVTLDILRILARVIKNTTSLLRSSHISCYFSPPAHNQEPGGQVKDVAASPYHQMVHTPEHRIILAGANRMPTIIILNVKPT